MEKHYSKGSISEWYKTETGKFECYGFGFDQNSPVSGEPTAAYVTYEFDPNRHTLSITGNPSRYYNENEAVSTIRCDSLLEAVDYSTRHDAALGNIVAQAVPESLARHGFDTHAWAIQPKDAGKDLTGLVTSQEIANVLSRSRQAVFQSYEPKKETLSDVTARAGLLPLHEVDTDSFYGLQFEGGNGAVLICEVPQKGYKVFCLEGEEKFELSHKPTLGAAIAAAAAKKPEVFAGNERLGKEREFQAFIAFERGATAAAVTSRSPDHKPYETTLRTLGNTPEGKAFYQGMLSMGIDRDSQVSRAPIQQPLTASSAPNQRLKAANS